jgi:hypothetical protein
MAFDYPFGLFKLFLYLILLCREKVIHDQHLRQLEDEMEREMQKMEDRIREKVC